MNTKSGYQRDKLNDLAGLLVLLVIGVIGVAVLATLFYSYW